MPINVAENRKMVTTNFGPEVEMLPFLRIRTKKMTKNVAIDHQQQISLSYTKSGSLNSMAATLSQLPTKK